MQSKIVPYNLNFTKRRNGQFIFDKKNEKAYNKMNQIFKRLTCPT